MKHYIQLLARMNWVLFGAMALMATLSILFIYSASYRGPGVPMPDFYKMQMVWFGVGLVLYLVLALVDYRVICQWATIWYVLAVGSLVLVLVVGAKVYGARRWLGVGSLGIQPVEIAKLAIIVAVAYYLFHRPAEMRQRWSTVWTVLLMVGMPQALIFVQPDLGSVMILLAVTFAMLFVAGVRVKHLALVALLGMCVAPFGWVHLKIGRAHV